MRHPHEPQYHIAAVGIAMASSSVLRYPPHRYPHNMCRIESRISKPVSLMRVLGRLNGHIKTDTRTLVFVAGALLILITRVKVLLDSSPLLCGASTASLAAKGTAGHQVGHRAQISGPFQARGIGIHRVDIQHLGDCLCRFLHIKLMVYLSHRLPALLTVAVAI